MAEYAKKARDLFLSGYNCSQAVVGAFAEIFGMNAQTAMRFAEGLGGGMGRMRLTCGAVSGMSLVVGLKMSTGEPTDTKTRSEIYATVRKMAEEFKEKNGSIICAELLGISQSNDTGPVPEQRTSQYYKKRPCAQCVYDCAEIIEKHLL